MFGAPRSPWKLPHRICRLARFYDRRFIRQRHGPEYGSILITDNDLTDGYTDRFDLTDAPASSESVRTEGSAAFQWGEISPPPPIRTPAPCGSSRLPLQSSLRSNRSKSATLLSQRHDQGHHRSHRRRHRNSLTFSQPLGMDPISVVFGTNLINTPNTSDPVASADIVSFVIALHRSISPMLMATATHGTHFPSRSEHDRRHAFHATNFAFLKAARAGDPARTFHHHTGRFNGTPAVPEPSSALIATLGALFCSAASAESPRVGISQQTRNSRKSSCPPGGPRINLRPPARGVSSVGRALAWHARGQRFESATLHHSYFQRVALQRPLTSVPLGTSPGQFTEHR